jgi:hypothetical protein
MSDSSTILSKSLAHRCPSVSVLAALTLTLLTSGTGCQTWMKPPAFANPMTWFKNQSTEDKHGVPQRLVVLWADDVMGQMGKASTRGFGGRLYFYNAEDKPVPVEGQLTVYAYDDTIPKKGSQRNPDRKFVFTAEQFQSHFSESQIGPSYSVWIPWEDIDGPRRDISLVPVFISSSGKVIMGPQTINVLAARTPEGESKYNQLRMSQKTIHGPLAQASHLEPANGGNSAAAGETGDPSANSNASEPDRPNRLGLRTSTIPLNGSMSERLRTAAPMPPIGVVPPTAPSNPATSNGNAGSSSMSAASSTSVPNLTTSPANSADGPATLTGGAASLGGRPSLTHPTNAMPPSNRLLPPPGFPSGHGSGMNNAPMTRLPPAATR